ncbi:MAG: hypothetical protein ACI90M_003897, partial [Candidatus Azotimanducaceae bacterium]
MRKTLPHHDLRYTELKVQDSWRASLASSRLVRPVVGIDRLAQ